MSKLSERIKFLREQLNLTQKDCSKILGITQANLSQFEKDCRIPPDEIKIKMADFFNVDLDYLMCRTDIPNRIKEDKLDISESIKDLDYTLEHTPNLVLHGEILDDETKKLLQSSLKTAILITERKKDEKS